MTRAMLTAILIGVPVTFLVHLQMTYVLGAGTAKMAWGRIGAHMWEQILPRWTGGAGSLYVEPQWRSVAAIGASMTFAFLLVTLRYRFLGFPLHPVGMTLVMPMSDIWAGILVAAVMKWATLRYTGLRGYRAALPFFLGLMLGDITMGTGWFVLGALLNTPTYVFFL